MQGPTIGLLGFALCILLMFLRVPVAISMGVTGAIGFWLTNGWDSLAFILGKTPFDAVFPYDLSVVPLFIMMGVFAAYAGLSKSLYDFVSAFVGQLRGGLAIATIGACAIFGAVCGSALATAATMGRVAMPEMRRLGYKDSLSSAAVAAGGTLGVMIPPSIMFALYGLMTEQSIGKLFISGILPGILGTFLYMAAVWIVTARDPSLAPPAPRKNWAERWQSTREVWRVLLLFGVVLGGMYFGWFTPTEAASVGAAGAMLLAWLGGHINRKMLKNCMVETTTTSAMIYMILIGAGVFNFFLDATGLNDALIQYVKDLGWNRWGVMFALMVMYIILGALMDEISMILLTVVPVFKLVTALDFDPIWFGVMLVTVCEIGLIVPPVGMNLFVIQGVAGIPLSTVVRGIVPFVMADCLRLLILCYLPWLATWLPSHMN
ncbi:MAG: TRAP transporter large permease [Betaproteobacteria bacterium]